MRFETGSRFGRYTIEAALGAGGMGAVYRAFDTLLHRRVALKVLHAAAAGDRAGAAEPMTERILREARAAAALHHPNAVAIFDIGEQDGVCFIAMELVSGRPLRELVGAPEIALERRLRWLADVARALAAAHRVGVVHLDVKPENVMIDADDRVKVLDFGIARQVVLDDDPSGPTATMTGSGGLAGTPAYMAPEQVRKLGVDSRTDQFSWGVVAYELLAGRMPWSEARSLFDLFSSIVHETPPSLGEACPEIPEEVEAVVSRALAKAPADRFPTMGALVEALEGGLGLERTSLPADAPRSGPMSSRVTPSPAVTTSRRRPTPARISAPEVPSDPTPAGTEREATTPSRRPRAPSRWRVGGLLLGAVLAAALGARALLGARAAVPAGPAATATATEPARVSLTELPPPAGCNATALAEYRAGIQAQHDGDWDEALVRFEGATSADPDCAGAHLRLVLVAEYVLSSARIREVYQRAVQLRAALSERDRLLVDALDPLVRRDPADEKEFTARVAALAKDRPGDAELACLAGLYSQDPDVKIAQARAALAIDPRYSDAYQLLAGAHKRREHMDEALGVLDECVREAPSSVDCVKERIDLHRMRGQCDEVVGDARLWIARAPRSTNGYYTLAFALAGQGAPPSAVEEALRQRWSRLPEAERARLQPLEAAQLDALSGRFDRAATLAREVDRLVDADPSYEPHARPALLLVNLDRELGRLEEASRRAADFLGRRSVWSANLRDGSAELRVYHLEPLLFDVELQGKKLTEPEWRAARAAWLSSARRVARLDEAALWAVGVAMAARTPAEAADAVRSMPPALRAARGAGYPTILSMGMYIGRALLLAGEVDAAIPFLQRAAGHCDALVIPFEDTQANVWLGQALEKKGDVAGACAAYQIVHRRWGQASPPPESAALAKSRMHALACPR